MSLGSKILFSIFFLYLILFASSCTDRTEHYIKDIDSNQRKELEIIFNKAGENSSELKAALSNVKHNQREGLLFLLRNMPDRDLKELSSDFLIDNVEYAYKVMDEVRWGNEIPKDIFLNYILPYANLHERRDNWRKDFYNKFLELIINLDSPSEAIIKLNNDIWDIIDVKYSTKRPKADQSPYESIEAGLASCTGLSILLIDVCRAVGIPARFVGVPLWKDESGNHSWVEIWDKGWHFIGAAEQSPLNETWFGERAKTSEDSEWKYSIYAVSFKETGVVFPPLFDSNATYVNANIITDRYSEKINDDGNVTIGVRLFDKENGERVVGTVRLYFNGEQIGQGETKDERYDYNDFLIFHLEPDQIYNISAESNGKEMKKEISINNERYQFINIHFEEEK